MGSSKSDARGALSTLRFLACVCAVVFSDNGPGEVGGDDAVEHLILHHDDHTQADLLHQDGLDVAPATLNDSCNQKSKGDYPKQGFVARNQQFVERWFNQFRLRAGRAGNNDHADHRDGYLFPLSAQVNTYNAPREIDCRCVYFYGDATVAHGLLFPDFLRRISRSFTARQFPACELPLCLLHLFITVCA